MTRRCALIAGLAVWPLCFFAAANGMPALNAPAAGTFLQQERVYNSLAEAVQAALYGARPDGLGFAAPNSRQHFVARFSEGGLRIDGVGWHTSWELRSIGYGERQTPVRLTRLDANGKRVDLRRGAGVTEWYVNGPRGLEQGFTLQRPAGERRAGERLRLMMEVSGDLRARDAVDGVELVRADGSLALRYEHLVVKDAMGRELAARMRVAEGAVSVDVDVAGAAWPVTIDPTFVQQAHFTDAGDKWDHDWPPLAISGDTVVVGDVWPGLVYVFVRNGTTWSQQATLQASNAAPDDLFGLTVAVSGDTIVVGALFEDSDASGVNGDQSNDRAPDSGAAYVFVRNGVTWSQQAYLKASNTRTKDYFGGVVAVSGETIVIGAEHEDSSATGVNGDQSNNSADNAGAAYVFVRTGVTWSQQAYLKASNTETGDLFGGSVALSGDTVVIGAFEDSRARGVNGDQSDNSAVDSGAAYVFVRNGVTWSQQAYLKASNTEAGDNFGASVAISGGTIVIGAYGKDSNAAGVNGDQSNNSSVNSGAAYVFVRNVVTWSQQAYLKASNPETGDMFGSSVGVSGDTVVVGAYGEDFETGAAYVFVRNGGTWSQQDQLKANPRGNDFGTFVAVSGGTVVVSQYHEGTRPGPVYVFVDGSICSQTLSVVSQSVGVGATTGTIGVISAAGCDWTAVSNVQWLTVTTGTGGTGNGTVGFLAAANLGAEARSGTLTVAGQTFTVLQAGTSTCVYALNPISGTSVPAVGGSGFALTMTTQSPCVWTATTNSNWLTVTTGSSGSGSGVVQYSVLANPGTQRTGAITIGGQIYTVTQAGTAIIPTPDNALTLSQLVGGGAEWHTTVFLTNLSSTPEGFTIRFYDDSGQAMLMPIEALGLVDSLSGTLGAGETRRYETGADATLHAAWALVTSATPATARLAGFAVFRHTVPSGSSSVSSEGVVDLTGVTDSKYVLLYDNFQGPVTTAAFANPDAFNSLTIQADIRDEQGALLATDSITLPPLGHTALVLTDRFPAAVGRQGSIRFSSSKGFTGLGLRFSPYGTYTSFRLMTSKDIQ